MARRLFDILFASATLAVASPILLAAAAGIWLADGLPILYRAPRVGREGRRFTMYKLRTMYVGAERGGPITAPSDSRCFRFGSILRHLKIDELPQLLNVLKGDMTMVGPRPEDPRIVAEHYTEGQRRTLEIRPGLLSPGSIFDYTHGEKFLASQNREEDYVRKLLPIVLALDTVYIQRASFSYDVRLLGRTAWVIACKALGRRRFPDPPEMKDASRLI